MYFSKTALANLQNEIEKKFQKELPFPSGMLRIHYSFTCSCKTDMEKFSGKLLEMNNEILYKALGNGCQIIAKTQNLEPNEQMVKQQLLTIAEVGFKLNCIIEDWRIEGDHNTKWLGGLVIKPAGVYGE